MLGGIDLEYVRARRVLLDALEALQDQREAIILVGAQAVYLHTGDTNLAVAPYTTDADLVLDPSLLQSDPRLEQAMERAGFSLRSTDWPGIWSSERENIEVDLIVPAAVSGIGGTRSARIEGHAKRVAMKTRGLEGALIDKQPMMIESLESEDKRRFEIAVAGPTALLVAKLHKLGERQNDPTRLKAKDALDTYRLLRKVETEKFVRVFVSLNGDERSRLVTREAIRYLQSLFADVGGMGSQLAAQALDQLVDPDEVTQSCAFLAMDILLQLQDVLPDIFEDSN
ncbi:MAG: GSU2403 family nucleotidyltransferase fold protein [Chloroflexota bacterium]|nr:GSU2403 family nucleotidyltransferase fold protein [Chloroflexota bacterium]MDQ6905320.1 GSU2403 family nucleotidyltransferase fold protein [Chloroflexota bacterium]